MWIFNFENTISKLNGIKSIFWNSDFIFWEVINFLYIILYNNKIYIYINYYLNIIINNS